MAPQCLNSERFRLNKLFKLFAAVRNLAAKVMYLHAGRAGGRLDSMKITKIFGLTVILLCAAASPQTHSPFRCSAPPQRPCILILILSISR